MKNLKVWTVLSHINLVLGVMFMTFFVIDRVNPAMDFIDSEISKWLLFAFAILALAQALVAIVYTRKLRRHRYEQHVSEERRRKRAEIVESMRLDEAGSANDAPRRSAENVTHAESESDGNNEIQPTDKGDTK